MIRCICWVENVVEILIARLLNHFHDARGRIRQDWIAVRSWQVKFSGKQDNRYCTKRRCCTKHPAFYRTTDAVQSDRCYAKRPVLCKTPGAVQDTRCYTKHPVLYKIPGAVQDTRCYTRYPVLYKPTAAIQNTRRKDGFL